MTSEEEPDKFEQASRWLHEFLKEQWLADFEIRHLKVIEESLKQRVEK